MRVEIKTDGTRAPYGIGEVLGAGRATTEIGVLRIANRIAAHHGLRGLQVWVDGRRQMIGVEGARVVALVCDHDWDVYADA